MRRVRDGSQYRNRVRRDDIKDCVKNVLGNLFIDPPNSLMVGDFLPTLSNVVGSTILDLQSVTPSALVITASLSAASVAVPRIQVTYNGNGSDTGATGDTNWYTIGSTVTVMDNCFIKTGSTFSKWNTAADGSGTDYNPADTFTITVPITLYAIWV